MASTLLSACNRGGEKMENLRQAVDYGRWMQFNFRIMIDGELITPTGTEITQLVNPDSPIYSSSHTEIAFFHTEEEALKAEKPDNVILAWRPERDYSQGLVNGINLTVLRNEIVFEEYGLTYPITVENLVDDWEATRLIWRRLLREPIIPLHMVDYVWEFGADAFRFELEIFHLVENPEVFDQIISRGEELGISWETGMEPLLDIFVAVGGNVEAFFNVAERMESEGLTVEQLLEELRE